MQTQRAVFLHSSVSDHETPTLKSQLNVDSLSNRDYFFGLIFLCRFLFSIKMQRKESSVELAGWEGGHGMLCTNHSG